MKEFLFGLEDILFDGINNLINVVVYCVYFKFFAKPKFAIGSLVRVRFDSIFSDFHSPDYSLLFVVTAVEKRSDEFYYTVLSGSYKHAYPENYLLGVN